MSDTRLRLLHADGRDMADGLFGYTMRPAQQPEQPSDSDRVLICLLARRTWITAEDIAANVFEMHGEAGRRRVRRAASDSKGAICSYPGSAGYKARSLLTAEERTHAIAAFKAQAAEMFRRASELEMTDTEQGQKLLENSCCTETAPDVEYPT